MEGTSTIVPIKETGTKGTMCARVMQRVIQDSLITKRIKCFERGEVGYKSYNCPKKATQTDQKGIMVTMEVGSKFITSTTTAPMVKEVTIQEEMLHRMKTRTTIALIVVEIETMARTKMEATPTMEGPIS